MIDDYAQATALVNKMNVSVPIPVRPTRQLVDTLRQKGVSLGHDPKLEIKKVFYMGDEGGIMCDVTPPGMETMPIICSLTHLEVLPGHPLADELRAYQVARTRKLARQGSGKPMSYTIKPKKGRR